ALRPRRPPRPRRGAVRAGRRAVWAPEHRYGCLARRVADSPGDPRSPPRPAGKTGPAGVRRSLTSRRLFPDPEDAKRASPIGHGELHVEIRLFEVLLEHLPVRVAQVIRPRLREGPVGPADPPSGPFRQALHERRERHLLPAIEAV